MRQRIRSLQKNREERTQSRQTTAEKVGKGRTMPRGNAGKAPQPEKARTSAPAEKKNSLKHPHTVSRRTEKSPRTAQTVEGSPPCPAQTKNIGNRRGNGECRQAVGKSAQTGKPGQKACPFPKGKSPMEAERAPEKTMLRPFQRGKTPLTGNAHTGAPAEEKGPSALSAELFGKEDAAAQGNLLRRRAMKRALGRAFFSQGGERRRGSRERKKALRQAVPAEKHPGNALRPA